MLPAVPFTFLVLLALLPGWIFVRLAETKSEPADRSQLAELLELAAVGFSAIAISALIVAGLSINGHYSWLFNVEAWAHTRNQYLGDHLGAAIASTALVIIISCILVVLLFAAIYHKRLGGKFAAGRTVWVSALGTAPPGMQNWIGIYRRDGSLVEGLFFSCTAGAVDGAREISLTAPIRHTPVNGEATVQSIDRIVIPDAEIASITVIHVPRPSSANKVSAPTAPSPSSS
jgi:Family of unknown function (DUF6338)